MENYLIHYGKKERSGRYPYGSGEDPFQRIKRSGFSKNKKKKIIKKAQQEMREKSVSEMSDKEIEKRLARLRLESNYEQEKRKRDSFDTKKEEQKPVSSEKPSYYGKSISEMSDSELSSFINRLKLEQQVEELTKKPEVKKGEHWMITALKDARNNSVKEVANQAAVYVLGEGLNKVTGKKIYVRKGGDKKK